MPTVRYTTVNGEIIAEKRGGVRRLYGPDPLGSTVALYDDTQTKTDTFDYWPYGEVRTRTGATPTPFQFVGTWGYYRVSASSVYVRARYLQPPRGRWLTSDPWPPSLTANQYRYAESHPVGHSDPSGLQTIPMDERDVGFLCGSCATKTLRYLDEYSLRSREWGFPNYGIDKLTHCAAACYLTKCAGLWVAAIAGILKELWAPPWDPESIPSFWDPFDMCANNRGEWCVDKVGDRKQCLACCLHMYRPPWREGVFGPPPWLGAPPWQSPPGLQFPSADCGLKRDPPITDIIYF